MADQQIRFDDGAAYEELMGKWSRLAGDVFLDWLAPPQGLRWIDVGCGNGAFTELLIARSAPASVEGVDPSEGQLAYARSRSGAQKARFQIGDAAALPFPDESFDAAAMALVIFFVPDPKIGVAEMKRVTKPGGLVSAYAWDVPGGGFPLEPMHEEMRAFGMTPLRPPSWEISRIDALQSLWEIGGLESVETTRITVRRSFASFDIFWRGVTGSASVAAALAKMEESERARLKRNVQARLGAEAVGSFSYEGHAHAVKGKVAENRA